MENPFKELQDEIVRLKARIKDLENVAHNVPLCGHHAEVWFCNRHFKEGDCWMCDASNSKVVELNKLIDYALGPDQRKWYEGELEKKRKREAVVLLSGCGHPTNQVCPECRPDLYKCVADYQ
jgi:hypothetical protein